MTGAADTLIQDDATGRDAPALRLVPRATIALIDDARLAARALALYKERRRRDARFGSSNGIFGEPLWDILLDLFVAQVAGRLVSVSSACMTSPTAQSTALRYVRLLETHGFITRHPDATDRRRCHLRLTAKALARMRSYLEDVGAS